jgi:flagellar basal-body rod protein FlgG
MTVQRNKMDVLTNNLVNAETVGYKKDTLITSTFDEVMLRRIHDPNVSIYGGNIVGGYGHGTHIDELITNFSDGNLEKTDRPADLAIVGNGFFVVETPAGQRYTRAGNFSVDGAGYLVTQDGNYVLGDRGRIYAGSSEFTVTADGMLTGPQADGDKLRLVTFEDPGILRKEGSSLYYAYGGAAPLPAGEAVVLQGMQESSNVNIADELVDMITVYRKYEASQKIVSMTDDTLSMAVSLGKVGGRRGCRRSTRRRPA